MKLWKRIIALLAMIVTGVFTEACAAEIRYNKTTETTACITYAEPQGDVLNIPSEMDGYTITSIRFEQPDNAVRIIQLPDSIEQINPGEFKDWLSLESIYIDPRNPHFFQSDGVLYSRSDRSLHTYPCAKRDRAYSIKKGTTSICAHAFQNCFYLEEVAFPESVVSIGAEAFAENNVLTICELPENLIEIGDSAFRACIEWKGSRIPETVTKIGINPYQGCDALSRIDVASKNACFAQIDGVLFDKRSKVLVAYPTGKSDEVYTVPNGICAIEEDAFQKNTFIKTVDLPQTIELIGAYAFQGCSSLMEVSLPDGLQTIEEFAFSNTSIVEIKIPSTVLEIADHTFYKCKYLKKVDWPKNVVSIGKKAFSNTLIEELKCPNTLVNIGEEAFSECHALKRIEFTGESCIVKEKAFKNDKMLCELLISGRISLENYAFEGCSNLKDINISGVVDQIGEGSFSACEVLESIHFPEGLTQIGERAFEKCVALREIELPYSTTTIGNDAFTLTDRFTLIVQPNSYAEEFAIDRGVPSQQVVNWL